MALGVFLDAIWPLLLGRQSLLHTKHWFALSLSMRHLFGTPMLKLRFSRLRSRERLLDGPFGDGGREVAKAICLLS